MDPDDTLPPEAPVTEPCPTLPDPSHEGFGIEYPLRRVTFLPEPLYDLSSEELDES